MRYTKHSPSGTDSPPRPSQRLVHCRSRAKPAFDVTPPLPTPQKPGDSACVWAHPHTQTSHADAQSKPRKASPTFERSARREVPDSAVYNVRRTREVITASNPIVDALPRLLLGHGTGR